MRSIVIFIVIVFLSLFFLQLVKIIVILYTQVLPLPDDEIVFQPPKIKTHSGYVTTTTTPKQHTHTQAFNATAYNQMLTQSTKQMSNMSTVAYFGVGQPLAFNLVIETWRCLFLVYCC